MPRIFTRAELTRTITTGMYDCMSEGDKKAFDSQLVQLWIDDGEAADARYLAGDYDRVGSAPRHAIGE